MQGTVVIDSLIYGDWNDATKAFAGPVAPASAHAMRVVLHRTATGLIMNGMGVPAPLIYARSIGWAEAPVTTAICIKPWALPYALLMSRINTVRGLPNTTANLTRTWDLANDIPALNSMSQAQRSFSLKLGSGSIDDPIADSLNISGNYQAVRLPKYTQDPNAPSPDAGGSAYEDAISGKRCVSLSVGDSLVTQGGVLAGPTIKGADKQNNQTAPYGVCESIVDNKNSPANGNCMNASNGVGVDIPAAFYLCETGCNGTSMVTVKLLGSFTLTKIYPNSDNGNNPAWEKAEVRGEFKPLQTSGPVGGGATTLQRPILVR